MWQGWPKWTPCGAKTPEEAKAEAKIMKAFVDEDSASSASRDLESDATLMDVNSEILDISHRSTLARPHPPTTTKRGSPQAKLAATPKISPKVPHAKLAKVPVIVVGAKQPQSPGDIPKGAKAKVAVNVPKKAASETSKKLYSRMKRFQGDVESRQTTALRSRDTRKTRNKRRSQKQRPGPPVPAAKTMLAPPKTPQSPTKEPPKAK